jgi:putative ABC transport system permease protein
MITLVDINKYYPLPKGELHVLKDINLTLPKQGFITILGPSGCGKTTLLNLIGGLDVYSSGDLLIDGKITKQFTTQDWDSYRNHHIGFVFQSYNLISHLTVYDNVELSLTLAGISQQERKDKVIKTLESVGLKDEIYKQVTKLSGGQMQRVAIARAIVNDPDIILADEPTGALDSKTSVQIMEILKEISKSRLVLMVTHNEQLAKDYSERIIRMLDGKIIDDSVNLKAPEIKEEKPLKQSKTSMSFIAALKSSFKNLTTKKGRSILISVAGSLGIIGVSLIIALSYGFQSYVSHMEKGVASTYPISIMSNAIDVESTMKNYEEGKDEQYPSDEKVFIYDQMNVESAGGQIIFNQITEDYIDYVKTFEDEGLAKSVIVNYMTRSNLITMRPNGEIDPVGETRYNYLAAIPTGSFSPLLGKEAFIRENYDLIGSHSRYPSNINEAVLLIDSYNRISAQTLENLGIINTGTTTLKELPFDDILGKKYKLIKHDDYYVRAPAEDVVVENKFSPTGTSTVQKFQVRWHDFDTFYNDPNMGIELEIVGVLRLKEGVNFGQLTPGLKYHPDLVEIMKNENVDSEISKSYSHNFASTLTIEELMALPDDQRVTAIQESIKFYSPFTDTDNPERQINYQVYLNSAKFHGATFQDIDTSTTAGQVFKYWLDQTYSLVESIAIFASDTNAKKAIMKRLDDYNTKHPAAPIKYLDAVRSITDAIATLVNVVTIVLLVFSGIALVVSWLLIGIITYISVVERTKEIGILRSIGARKLDIMRLFESENFIIGNAAGLIGILFAYLLMIPLNVILNSQFPNQGLEHIANLPAHYAILLIVINVVLTMLAGLIPSLQAAKKNPVEALRVE